MYEEIFLHFFEFVFLWSIQNTDAQVGDYVELNRISSVSDKLFESVESIREVERDNSVSDNSFAGCISQELFEVEPGESQFSRLEAVPCKHFPVHVKLEHEYDFFYLLMICILVRQNKTIWEYQSAS